MLINFLVRRCLIICLLTLLLETDPWTTNNMLTIVNFMTLAPCTRELLVLGFVFFLMSIICLNLVFNYGNIYNTIASMWKGWWTGWRINVMMSTEFSGGKLIKLSREMIGKFQHTKSFLTRWPFVLLYGGKCIRQKLSACS